MKPGGWLSGRASRFGLGAIALAAAASLAGAAASAAAASMPSEPVSAPGAPLAPPRLELTARGAVRAGQALEIRWSGGRSIDELELQLSLDGGRHYVLRVSPELDAESERYVWRVPNLATSQARLRLRFHRGGREIDGEPSAPFRILMRSDARAELDQIHENIWWRGTYGLDLPGAAAALAAPAASLGAHVGAMIAAVAPRTLARVETPVLVTATRAAPCAALIAAPRTTGATPRDFPHRN